MIKVEKKQLLLARFLHSNLWKVATLTVALSISASDDVGDRGLTGLIDGELSTLET